MRVRHWFKDGYNCKMGVFKKRSFNVRKDSRYFSNAQDVE